MQTSLSGCHAKPRAGHHSCVSRAVQDSFVRGGRRDDRMGEEGDRLRRTIMPSPHRWKRRHDTWRGRRRGRTQNLSLPRPLRRATERRVRCDVGRGGTCARLGPYLPPVARCRFQYPFAVGGSEHLRQLVKSFSETLFLAEINRVPTSNYNMS
jgi:hypothetical protein